MNTLIAVDNSGSYRVYLTISTDLCEQAMQIHDCVPTAAAALGRTLTCAGMMGLMLKSMSDKLTVQIKGDGPAEQILATADALGRVKGYIVNSAAQLPAKPYGHLDVGGIVGNGRRSPGTSPSISPCPSSSPAAWRLACGSPRTARTWPMRAA